VILLIGETEGLLGQSLYLRDICGREEGEPPSVDLVAEKRNGDFVRALIAEGVATAVHDISDGGLLVALAEMAMASGIGAEVAAPDGVPTHAFWFGEDQARYVITVREEDAQKVISRAVAAGVPVARLGHTGGDAVAVSGDRPVLLSTLSRRHESWFPDYMSGTNG